MTIKTHTFDNGYTVEVQQGGFSKCGFTYEYKVLISAGGYMCETRWYDDAADLLDCYHGISKRDQHRPCPLFH